MEPFDDMRSAGELLAQRTMERVVDLVVQSLDVNALLATVDVDSVLRQVDVDALLERVDVNAIVSRVDVNALLDRVDVNRLVTRVDMAALAQQTDISAVLSLSSGSAANEAVDTVRGQFVALDRWIDHWVRRLLHRKGAEPMSPRMLLKAEAGT